MIFKILLVNLEKLIYSISFYQEIEEILDYGIEYISLEKSKHIDYLFASLQVTKNLTPELKEDILNRYLITEFREEYFIEIFEKTLLRDLGLFIEIDIIENTFFEDIFSDNTTFSLDSYYYSD